MEPKVNGYMIVEGKDPADLVGKVNGHVKNGWRPTGGPTVVQLPDGQGILQALITFESSRH